MESSESEGQSTPNVFNVLTVDTPKRSNPTQVPDPALKNGRILPKKLQDKFVELKAWGKPLEEIDPYYENGKTFIVVSSNFRIFRYSSHHSLFLFDPLNTLRRYFIFILTHWIYSFVMTTVVLLDFTNLVNHLSKATSFPSNHFHVPSIFFLLVYLAEFFIKCISMGFAMSPFTYLRSFWCWLDMLVIVDYFLGELFVHVPDQYAWPTSSWVLLKIISYNSGLHLAFDFCISCVARLKEMILASLVVLSMLTILGVQMYMGLLTQNCIRDFNATDYLNVTEEELHKMWHLHSSNYTNWYYAGDSFGISEFHQKLCGNTSGSGLCPEGYTCLQGFVGNPDYGFTNFDSFFWGFLTILRLVTQDFAELLIQQIFVTAGHFHAVYFLCVIFFGTFGLGTFAYAVVAHTFLELKESSDENEDSPNQNIQNRFAASRLFQSWNLPPRFNSFRRQTHCFVFHPFSEVCITCIIILDVLLMILNVEQQIFSHIFCWIYLFEFLLKLFAESPSVYFQRREHVFDTLIVVLYVLTLFISSNIFTSFLVIRMFKLFPRWPSLNFLIHSFVNTLKSYYHFFSLLLIIIIANAARGVTYSIFMSATDGGNNIPYRPRWHYKDFQHSFMTVFRVACGEWIECLWDSILFDGLHTGVTFFIPVLLVTFLLLLIASIAVIAETGETFKKIEFQENTLYSKFEDGLKRVCVPITWLRSKINPGGQTHNILEETPIHRQSQLIDDTNGDSSPVPDSAGAAGRNESVVDRIIKNKYYSIFSIAVLLWCSFALTFDNDVSNEHGPQANVSQTHLGGNETDHTHPSIIQLSTEIFFTIYFGVNILLNLFSCILKKSFVSSGWIFDVVLIVEMIFNLTMYSSYASPLHGFFYVKCFRPFMLVSRLEGLKAVISGIITEISFLWKYLLAGCFVLLAFDIQGVQLFQNRFGKCWDADGDTVSAEIIANKSQCLTANMTWVNSMANFDNSFNGILPLFYTLTINGWISVLHDAVDVTGIDEQPVRDASFINVFYIMFVMTCGSFFLFFILVGIIIHYLRTDTYEGIFMTFHQFYNYKNKARQLLASAQSPQGDNSSEEKIPEPTWRFLKFFYNVVESPFFDKFIMTVIICQILVLSLDYYQHDSTYVYRIMWDISEFMQFIVTIIYAVEMIFKLLAWRHHYFKSIYNRIDFVITISLLSGLIVIEFVETYFISPYLLTILRFFRIFQFEPFRRRAVLSQTFLKSLGLIRPALLNLLLFLVINLFSFSLLFMATFKNIKLRAGLNEDFNFHSFHQSISMLYQISTFGGWDPVYEALGDDTECDLPDSTHVGNCGSRFKASVMIFCYLSVSVFVVMNIYIVFVLEIVKRLSEKKSEMQTNDTAVGATSNAESSSTNIANSPFDSVNAKEFTRSSFA